MTNNYPRPQLKPGTLRILDNDRCKVVPGEGSFDNPGGSGGYHGVYHQNHALQNLHISRKRERNIQKIINNYTRKVERASESMRKRAQLTGLGHIKPND
jgi:hypothetical protein